MSETSILDGIRGPDDVRALSRYDLERLAAEVRRRIAEVVSERGGHLASNLGAVELTIALHRVFDFRRDRLVLDVGHQCYAHKLLTGRAPRFATLRSKGGVSGFPSPAESEFDPFVTGHASTAISSALGLAVAMRGTGARAVAVVGDGAVQGGLAFEGLNHAGHLGADLLVVLNDNEMSISRTVGALSRHLSRLRADPRYNEMRRELKALASRSSLLSGLGHAFAELARRTLAGGGVFQALGFRYFGPCDGHDLQDLEETLRAVAELRGPVLLHVVTQKGRGHAAASVDPAGHHSTAPAKVCAGREEGAPERPTYSEVASKALCDLGSRDPKVAVVTAAMAEGTGVACCAEAWPERVYDVGICEGHAVTFAAGLAKGAMRAVVALYSTFLQRAYDSVFHDVCLQGDLGVTLLVDRAGLVGEDGPTHHGLYDVAYLRALPNIVLAAPRDGDDLARLVEWAVALGRPVAVRYPRARTPEPVAPPSEVVLGRGEVLSEGERVAVLAYGSMVAEAARAVDALAPEGVRPTLVNARFVKPLDGELVSRLAASHARLVTVEEAALAGGFGSAVTERVADAGLGASRVVRLGVPDGFVEHATRAGQLAELGLDAAGIARSVRAAWDAAGGGA